LGCNITISSRYREIVRREARINPAVNGHFICDRGRYGYAFANLENRPRKGRIHDAPATSEEILLHLTNELADLAEQYGSNAIAVFGSARSSLESLTAINTLCNVKDYLPPVFFPEKYLKENISHAAANLSGDLSASIEDLTKADIILVVGTDPLNEAPMLALTLRQAYLNGALIVVLDPRPIELPCEFYHLLTAPDALSVRLAGLIQASLGQNVLDQIPAAAKTIAELEAVDIHTSTLNGKLDAVVVEALKKNTQPVILCGTQINDALTIDLAADAVRLLRKGSKDAGLFYLLPDANSFGIGLLASDSMNYETVLKKMESGWIKALIAVECDPLMEFCQRLRLEKALEKVELLVAIDQISGPFSQKAHLLLPSTTIDECGGTFINTFCRAQYANKALVSGTPITQTGLGNHPPRSFTPTGIDENLLSPAKILLHLADKENIDLKMLVTEAHNAFKALDTFANLPPNGVNLNFDLPAEFSLENNRLQEYGLKTSADNENLTLLLIEWTIGTERISCLSPALIETAKDPILSINPSDALSLGLASSPKVVITTDTAKLSVPICLDENVTPGVLILPCHQRLDWQVLSGRRFDIYPEQIKIHVEE
jgi:NADH-quinone oxidoreductase subunit G